MSNSFIYTSVNLKILRESSISLPLTDLGVLYGWGLFETIRIHNKKPILLDEHLARLKKSARAIKIPLPFSPSEIKSHLDDLIMKILKENYMALNNSTLNIYLTAGPTNPNNFYESTNPQLIIKFKHTPQQPASTNIIFAKAIYTRNNLNRYKTLAYLPNILEKKLHPNYFETILHDQNQEILEGTKTSVFFIKNKEVITTLSPFILPGITQNFLTLNQKEIGYRVTQRKVELSELADFDEIFLTNSLGGVILVDSVHKYPNLKSEFISENIQSAYNNCLKL